MADALNIPFFDADDFHPASNIEKMASGLPLDDGDRQPWLEKLANNLSDWQEEGGAVLACSALKESYRATLGSQCGKAVQWVILDASEELLAERLAARKGHYLDPALLRSQVDTFELPDYGWRVDVTSSPQEIINSILMRLRGE